MISVNLVFALAFLTPVFGQKLDLGRCMCTQIYDPVCGSNGITYSNPCEFGCAQATQPSLTILAPGACQGINDNDWHSSLEDEEPITECICPLDYNPVCGSDGKTYNNVCSLDCARRTNPSLTLATFGECSNEVVVDLPALPQKPIPYNKHKDSPRCFCTREYRPVCATNGKTYNNVCEFKCAKQTAKGLEIIAAGAC